VPSAFFLFTQLQFKNAQEQRNPRVIHSKSTRAAFSLIIFSLSAKKVEWEQQFALAKSSSGVVGTLASRSGLKLRDLMVAQNGQN